MGGMPPVRFLEKTVDWEKRKGDQAELFIYSVLGRRTNFV